MLQSCMTHEDELSTSSLGTNSQGCTFTEEWPGSIVAVVTNCINKS